MMRVCECYQVHQMKLLSSSKRENKQKTSTKCPHLQTPDFCACKNLYIHPGR